MKKITISLCFAFGLIISTIACNIVLRKQRVIRVEGMWNKTETSYFLITACDTLEVDSTSFFKTRKGDVITIKK